MAFFSLLNPNRYPIKKSSLSISFTLFPTISSSSSLFSSLCRRRERTTPSFSLPSQTPPVPKKVPFTITAHGKTWKDPYRWMSNIDDPDLTHYLNHENSYAEAFMADTQNLQRTLFSEMRSRMPAEISTPPERWGPWLYYQYIPEGKEYPVLCRRLGTEKEGWVKNIVNYVRVQVQREEILLDWNEVAEKYGYVHVGTCRISPDHNFLAYTLDTTGDEQFTLQVKDLKEGTVLSTSIVDGVVSLAWAQDGVNLFYTISDENQRPYRVLCTKVGSGDVDDVSIYTENDSSFCVDITSTKDGKFITVNSNSRNSSEEEVYLIDATNPQDGLQRIHKRVPGVQYFLEHHNGLFYVLTSAPLIEKKLPHGAYYLVTCRVEDIQSGKWQNFILPSEDTSIQDMDIFNGHLVLFLDKKGLPMICSINLPFAVNCKKMDIDDLNPWYFPVPSNLCKIVPGSNHDFMNSTYRVVLSSLVLLMSFKRRKFAFDMENQHDETPDVIVDYDMSQQKFSIVQQEDVLVAPDNAGSCSSSYASNTIKLENGQNSAGKHIQNLEMQRWKDFSDIYSCEMNEVVSHDGVKVPLTILYSRQAWKKGQSPGLLHGYGAYGEILDKSWCTDRLSLLNRGWVLAFADVRGSSGVSSWHKSGSGLHKLNSILDFVSCGKYLINEGYIHRDRLGAFGISAGALLVGAAINMNPDLFCAAILKVPFLDIRNTLLDPSLPLTILDYEEFGNPQLQPEFEYISRYSPYDNIPQGGCHQPSMLITASFHDSRVGVWEAAKWVAKVRDNTCTSCSRSVILKTNMSGGHFGEGGRFGQCEESSYEYAFLMKVMGMLDNNK